MKVAKVPKNSSSPFDCDIWRIIYKLSATKTGLKIIKELLENAFKRAGVLNSIILALSIFCGSL